MREGADSVGGDRTPLPCRGGAGVGSVIIILDSRLTGFVVEIIAIECE